MIMRPLFTPSAVSAALLLACTLGLSACNNDSTTVEVSLGDPVTTGDTIALTDLGLLISFNRTAPQTLISIKSVLGLKPSDVLIGIDYRPADGKLYGIGKLGNVYVLDPSTGGATFKVALSAKLDDSTSPYSGITGDAQQMALDFNPVADRLRVIGNDGQNLRINVDTGEVTTDTPISAPIAASVTGAAYSNSLTGTGTTALYDIDVAQNRLYIQSPPNEGTLLSGNMASLGVNADGTSGFDIDPLTNKGYAVLQVDGVSMFYGIDLSSIGTTNNAATKIGALPTNAKNIRGIALKPVTATVYGLTANNQLTSLSATTPNNISALMPITGLLATETVIGMDVRVNTSVAGKAGLLYGLTNLGNLYTINPSTGVASRLLTLQTLLQGTAFGVDFNPVADRLRVVSNTGQNLRIDVDTGAVTTDSNINLTDSTPSISAIAYTNSFLGATATTGTTLYDLDSISNNLYSQTPPNDGSLVLKGSTGITVGTQTGFDIAGGENGLALATIAQTTGPSTLYVIDLKTGMATPAAKLNGTASAAASMIGSSTTPALIDIAIMTR
jgi:hypothetical protein